MGTDQHGFSISDRRRLPASFRFWECADMSALWNWETCLQSESGDVSPHSKLSHGFSFFPLAVPETQA